jgi:hypothetical protein
MAPVSMCAYAWCGSRLLVLCLSICYYGIVYKYCNNCHTAQEGRALPTKSTGTSVWPAALVLAKCVAHALP